MKVKREWADEQEAFGAVAEALSEAEADSHMAVYASDEQGEYGERGTIIIEADGRRFAIELHEIL
jgi:hypothetical protein